MSDNSALIKQLANRCRVFLRGPISFIGVNARKANLITALFSLRLAGVSAAELRNMWYYLPAIELNACFLDNAFRHRSRGRPQRQVSLGA
jgi:hypothetical protein